MLLFSDDLRRHAAAAAMIRHFCIIRAAAAFAAAAIIFRSPYFSPPYFHYFIFAIIFVISCSLPFAAATLMLRACYAISRCFRADIIIRFTSAAPLLTLTPFSPTDAVYAFDAIIIAAMPLIRRCRCRAIRH